MNNRRTKMLPKIILGQLFVGLIMACLGFSVLFFAEGYRFNILNFKIIKTGVASFSAYPRDSKIYVNDKLLYKGSRFSTSAHSINLTGGYYTARAERDGYVTWNSSFRIEPGLVSDFGSIVLFKNNIVGETLTDQARINSLNAPVDTLANKDSSNPISVGSEIWLNNKLVTRFSSPVLNTKWYSDQKHILYQIDDQSRIMDIDGSNNVLLITLKTSSSTNYFVNYRGDELYYIDNNEYMMAKIR